MKNIGFVPLRIGSKSIPKKNIKLWNGKPLLFWVCYALEKSKSIHEFYVASDSKEIDEIFSSFGFKKGRIFSRSPINAKDTSSSESVLLEFLKSMNFNDDHVICFCQSTSPYLESQDIDKAIELLKKPEYDSILSVTKFFRFIWGAEGTPINYNLYNRPRRQEMGEFFLENGAIYISNANRILSSKNRISGKVGYHIMDDEDSIELDEPNDWLFSEQTFPKDSSSTHFSKKTKLFISDIDGTLTDGGMYYSQNGEAYKKFNTRDGMGFELLRKNGIKTALITSEDSKINKERAQKLSVDFLYQKKKNKLKADVILELVDELNLNINEVAYIGDDINCIEALQKVGKKACPSDANTKVKAVEGIIVLSKKGGEGCVREFIDDHILAR